MISATKQSDLQAFSIPAILWLGIFCVQSNQKLRSFSDVIRLLFFYIYLVKI